MNKKDPETKQKQKIKSETKENEPQKTVQDAANNCANIAAGHRCATTRPTRRERQSRH